SRSKRCCLIPANLSLTHPLTRGSPMCNPPHSASRDRSWDVWGLLAVVAWGKITILFCEVGHSDGSGSSERLHVHQGWGWRAVLCEALQS
uniref:Uncharacterized protein n=1 Tax=Gopherus agassizii TaxID=38772 RepID=A0A452GI23_9SAUR